ncbi:MAG: M23 family metallopeptidase [Fusobacterium sp.]|uniref:peptidoglycan DD-metalloendopeptidase family protein n=1 Tax=Fusobacterium sp. TaxID=68766 RepID=UPI0026DDB431|nr:M23 family metallopeptidase [Fusobacterium sp.]MDO4690734.1 M23 family metallopeptidase [Fusobacterium sp.]
MKKIIPKFFICSLVLTIAVLSARLYKISNTEVLNTSTFTDYFQLDESDNGGLEIVLDSFTTLKKEYDFTEKIVKDIQKVEIIKYKVAAGDSLQKIANKFNISVDTIKINNKNARTGKLKVGDNFTFPSQDGFYYKIKKNDTISKISKLYDVKAADIISFNDIDPKKLKAGANIFLKDVNYKKFMQIEQNLNKAPVKTKTSGTKKASSGSSSPSGSGSSGFAYPVKFSGVASPFGNRFHPVLKKYILHTGVDFVAKYIPLRAAKDGVVSFTGNMSGYGKIIIIKHSDGYETRYAHLSVISTKVGEYVNKGDLIGKTGASGRVTGPHLHFEIRKDGVPKNPMKYL